MNSDSTSQVLNRLWVIHQYSLANYVSDAPPWWKDDDASAAELLRDVVEDQRRLADRFGTMMVEYGGELAPGKFPARFAALHDLASEFMWAVLLSYQQRTIEAIEKAVAMLPRASMAQALTQESLGVAKAHLDSMREFHVETAK